MAKHFEIHHPLRFYGEFVKRSFDEYVASPLDPYRAKMAASNADVMAERMWRFYIGNDPVKVANTSSPGDYRTFLVNSECADFQLIWDVNDSHKHVRLDRGVRRISSAAQAGVRRKGGAIGSAAINETSIGGSIDEFVVVLDDGSERPLLPILRNVIDMWERILSQCDN